MWSLADILLMCPPWYPVMDHVEIFQSCARGDFGWTFLYQEGGKKL